MKIETDAWGLCQTTTLDREISRKLNGDDYGRGALEAAEATASNTSEMIAEIVQILARRGLLTTEDLAELLGVQSVKIMEEL